jgi:FlgD Ig-like domain
VASTSERGAPQRTRSLAIAVVLVLLAATAAAFAYTERQKLERGTVSRPRATHYFSPGCDCEKPTATVAFRLSKRETVTVRVVDEAGREVTTLADRERFPAGTVRLDWDGTAESGEVVPDGSYTVELRTAARDATLVFPQAVIVDTVPPRAKIRGVRPATASAGQPVVVGYWLNEIGRAVLSVDGVEVAVGERHRIGRVRWDGMLDGTPAGPGTYELTVVGVDLAGNASLPTGPVEVVIQP